MLRYNEWLEQVTIIKSVFRSFFAFYRTACYILCFCRLLHV